MKVTPWTIRNQLVCGPFWSYAYSHHSKELASLLIPHFKERGIRHWAIRCYLVTDTHLCVSFCPRGTAFHSACQAERLEWLRSHSRTKLARTGLRPSQHVYVFIWDWGQCSVLCRETVCFQGTPIEVYFLNEIEMTLFWQQPGNLDVSCSMTQFEYSNGKSLSSTVYIRQNANAHYYGPSFVVCMSPFCCVGMNKVPVELGVDWKFRLQRGLITGQGTCLSKYRALKH